MPLLKLQTTPPVADEKKAALIASASKMVSEVTGKPETYVMVILETAGAASVGGQAGPAAFIDVRGIGGLTAAVNGELSRRMCELLQAELGIPGSRVYLTFTDVAASNWGWDGRTFG